MTDHVAASFALIPNLDLVRTESSADPVPASISSEMPIEIPFEDGWTQVLSHDDDAVDLSAAARGLPLLWSHNRFDRGALLGSARNVRVVKRRLVGELHFASSPEGQQARRDVIDGHVANVSVGGTILGERTVDDASRTITITRWRPDEVSLTPVPADQSVGINRARSAMPPTDVPAAPAAPPATPPAASPAPENLDALLAPDDTAIARAATAAERERHRTITETFEPFLDRHPDVARLRDQCIQRGTDVATGSRLLLEFIGRGALDDAADINRALAPPAPSLPAIGRVESGETESEKFGRIARLALCRRAGIALTPDELDEVMRTDHASWRALDFARESLRLHGIQTNGWDSMRIIGQAIIMRHVDGTPAANTSTFPALLSATVNKAVGVSFDEHPSTWSIWCHTGTLADFKQGSRPTLSSFSDLAVVAEGAEYQDGSLADRAEYIQLQKLGRIYSVTREALINDDLGELNRVGSRMGRAAARSLNALPYAVLKANAAMNETGNALFSAAHGNLVTTGDPTLGPPDMDAVEDARVKMALQQDANSIPVAIEPAFLICPIQLRGKSNQLLEAEFDPATAGTGAPAPNIVKDTYVTVADVNLTDADEWYMAGPRGTTIEVAFLDGIQTPSLEESEGWKIDAAHWKVRLEAAAAAVEYRALYKNDGA